MDVVAACPDVEWLQDLMKGLIDGNNGDSYSQDAVESCQQLAKCISEKILKPDRDMDKKRLVACFTTLLLIGKFILPVLPVCQVITSGLPGDHFRFAK